MRYLSFITGSLLFILLLGFFLKNKQMVTIAYYLGLSWQMPLAVLILLSFTAGVLVALIASLTIITKQKRALIALNKTTKNIIQHA